MRPDRAARALRGLIAASVATFVALLGHVAGGGQVPGWLGILAPFVLSLAVAVLLTGRLLSLLRLSLSVTVSQLLFHALFVLGSPRRLVAQGPGHHHGPITLTFADAAPVHLDGGTAMWIGHLLGAIVTIAALHRGEYAVRALLRLAARTVEHVVAAAARAPLELPVLRLRPAGAPAPVRRPLGVGLEIAPHRGPPAALAA